MGEGEDAGLTQRIAAITGEHVEEIMRVAQAIEIPLRQILRAFMRRLPLVAFRHQPGG